MRWWNGFHSLQTGTQIASGIDYYTDGFVSIVFPFPSYGNAYRKIKSAQSWIQRFSFHSLQTGTHIARVNAFGTNFVQLRKFPFPSYGKTEHKRKREPFGSVQLWSFHSLHTGKRIQRWCHGVQASPGLLPVSIPFKRESVSQDRLALPRRGQP